MPTERFPERVFQLSLCEILFLLRLLSIHPKLKNEIAKCEVQTGERRIKIMQAALIFHINVGLIISRYEAKVTIDEIYASRREFVED